jgi:hypothetical protein
MKKFISTMIVLALCIAPSVALSGGKGWRHFHGTYEMTASGSCIHSEKGFEEVDHVWYKAIEAIQPGTVYAGTTVFTGTWTFEQNGTGIYSDKIYATVTPPADGSVAGGVRIFEDSEVPFTYKITSFGDIVITEVNPPFIEYTGTVSPDRKTIILIDTPKVKPIPPAPPLDAPFWYILCNASRTLIRVNQ